MRCYEASALFKQLANERGQLVAGDFNALSVGDDHRMNRAPWWVRAQLLMQAGMTPRWALRRLLDAEYLDCYRARNPPGSNGFTVPAWDPQVRIDYLFASRDLEPALRASGVGGPTVEQAAPANPRRSLGELLGRAPVRSLNGAASDHLPVWADFEWDGAPA